MKKIKPSSDETLISLSDLLLICKKGKWKILSSALLFAALFSFYSLSKPTNYNAKAIFHDAQASSQSDAGGILKSLTGLSGNSGSTAKEIMLSGKLLIPFIKKLGLQSSISEIGLPKGLKHIITENLAITYGKLRKHHKYKLLIDDIHTPLQCSKITYTREFSLGLRLSFTSESDFTISFPPEYKKKDIQAHLGEAVEDELVSFTLSKIDNTKLKKKQYALAFPPIKSILDHLQTKISIDPTPGSGSVLELSYQHRDRKFAPFILNELMQAYQEYLKEESLNHTQVQLTYLEGRKESGKIKLKESFGIHQRHLEQNSGDVGFADLQQEAAYLSERQTNFKKELHLSEISLNLLLQASERESITETLSLMELENKNKNSSIHNLIVRIRDLIQKRNALKQSIAQNKNYDAKKIGQVSQRIQLLSSQLETFLNTKLEETLFHRNLIQKRIDEITTQIAKLPQKLNFEKELEINANIDQAILSQVAQAVETTIISQNLNTFKSHPLDYALPQNIPNSPNFFLLSLAGAFFGGIVGAFSIGLKSFPDKVTASIDNLALAGQRQSGVLSLESHKKEFQKLNNSDKNCLRSITSFLAQKTDSKCILLNSNIGPDFSEALASLLAKKGERILLINTPLSDNIDKASAGLIPFLEGSSTRDKLISKHAYYDTIAAGKKSTYALEHMSSQKFTSLLEEFHHSYDRVILHCRCKADNTELRGLYPLADSIVNTLTDEMLYEIREDFFLNDKITWLFSTKLT